MMEELQDDEMLVDGIHTYDKLANKYGVVYYKYIRLALSQLAYLAGHDDKTIGYYATAYDRNGNKYEIKWDIKNPNCDDEMDACNWEDYTVTKL